MLYDAAVLGGRGSQGGLSILRPQTRPVSVVAGLKCFYPPPSTLSIHLYVYVRAFAIRKVEMADNMTGIVASALQ